MGSNCAHEHLSASCHNGDTSLFSEGAASSGDMTGSASHLHPIHCTSDKAKAKCGVAQFCTSDKTVLSSTWTMAKHTTDKNFCDDHRDINKLSANSTRNDNPPKDVIGAHSLPPGRDVSLLALATSREVANRLYPRPAGGRPFMRATRQTRGRTPAHTESRCPIASTSSDPFLVTEVHTHSTNWNRLLSPRCKIYLIVTTVVSLARPPNARI